MPFHFLVGNEISAIRNTKVLRCCQLVLTCMWSHSFLMYSLSESNTRLSDRRVTVGDSQVRTKLAAEVLQDPRLARSKAFIQRGLSHLRSKRSSQCT